MDDRTQSGIQSQSCRIGIWRFLFSIVALRGFRQVFVAGTNSTQWSFRHKSVDKQHYSPSLGIPVCFLFFLLLAV